MATSYYSTGTISLTNGSAVVTGSGTAWQTALIEGGNIFPKAVGMPLPIASVDSNVQITAEFEWVGATGTYEYRIQRDTAYLKTLDRNSENVAYLLDEMRKGTLFKYDASGTLADLSLFNARPKGFSYLAIGGPTAALYVKQSNADGDWVGPYTYGGAGPAGPAPTLTVGTVGTVAPGQQPSAVFVGGNGAYALNLTLPEGELTPADEALLDQKVAAATAEANRAASYVPGIVASSISGLTLSNHPQFPNQLLVVAPGVARDRTNSVDIVLAVGTYKNLSTAWSAGTNGGGLDTGAVQAAVHYHVHLIRNPTSGAVDVLFSLSPTAPVMPSGFTQRRRIGAVATGTAGVILPGRWYGGWFQLSNPAYQPISGADNSAVALRDVFVPKGVKMIARMYVFTQQPSAVAGHIVVSDPDAGVPIAGNAHIPGFSKFLRIGGSAAQEVEEWTDANGRCYFLDTSGAGALVTVWAKGWYDHRDEFA